MTIFGSDSAVSHAIRESRRFAIDSAAGTWISVWLRPSIPGRETVWMHNRAELWHSSEPLLLRRIRPKQNERRFYAMSVTEDLFGKTVLVRNWGRIGTGGRQRFDYHKDEAAARASLEKLAAQKRRRGYV
ncbi:WGR domain-containing protein [Acidocella aquatica]|uniref:WGR domain-containing protein n=1 Tax=Acidocella aquatica TaxID=1922313 RepID=UPI0024E0A4DB|nr:WGR domain-containing protein [Acidocella aquatica]